MRILENTNPKNVFRFFEEISAVPRPSKHEEKIAEYLVNFAKERNLEVIRDNYNNVIIKKPASIGYENAPGVILQGHSDMVAEKNEGTEHDFLNEGLKLYVEGDFLKAEGTTLGADNGIAVAYALAILDGNYSHPKLCVVITSDEEMGMTGAKSLDLSLIEGYPNFINLDTDAEGIFTVSCAGGKKVEIHIPIVRELQNGDYTPYEVVIKGLSGGHSGMDIHKNLANSNRLMGRIMAEFTEVQIIEINGGAKPNAIPREAKAIFSFDIKEISKMDDIIEAMKKEYSETDPNLSITYKEVETHVQVIRHSEDIVNALMLLPNGVIRQTEDGTIASTNIGVVETREDCVIITNATRSSILSLRDFIGKQIVQLTKLFYDADVYFSEGYPAWEYKKDNPLRDKALQVYKEFSGKEGTVELSHGGLECGIFASQMEGVNFIALGPNNYNLHTPDEQLNIPSTERVFNFLIKLLEELN